MSTMTHHPAEFTVTRPVAITAALALITAIVLAIVLPILLSSTETVRVPGPTRFVSVDTSGGSARAHCVVNPVQGGVAEC